MTIAEIKERLRITEVLAKYGLSVKKGNMIHCPFHDDKTPSMQVYPKTDSLYCFSGNCEHGAKKIDVIDFIMYIDKSTKAEAIQKAKEMIGVESLDTQKPKISAGNTLETNTMTTPSPTIIFEQLQKHFPKVPHGKAVKYLKSRNIYDIKLEIGWRPEGYKYLKMVNCIVFPLKNEKKEIVSFYGRRITTETKDPKIGKHHYSSNRKGLYPCYPESSTRRLILTESVIDCLTLQKYLPLTSEDFVLALYGTNGLVNEHIKALQQCKDLEEIIFFLDGDQAGRAAVKKYANMLFDTLEVNISQVETPEGEDPNSLVNSHEPSVLAHLIEERKVLFSSENKSIVQSPQSIASVAQNPNKPAEALGKTPTEALGTAKDSVLKTNDSRLNIENKEYLVYSSENLFIAIIGGIGLHPIDKLKVTLKVSRSDSKNPLHQVRHSLDLYLDDQVEKFVRKASERLEIGSKDMLIHFAQVTQALEEYRLAEIEKRKEPKLEERVLSEKRKEKAMQFLASEELLKKTNTLIGKSGMVGEENNRLLMYLVFTSRLRKQPLHIVSLGASGTGKTYLQEKIAELIPEDQKLEITTMSENALYYFQKTELKNKLVLIEDLDGANDDKVLFAIRELQSKKRISKTVPVKDAKGNMQTMTLQVEGPISLAGTTTKEKLYEDNANRSLLIYLDNSKAHKEAIMDYQRKLSAGQIDKEKEEQVKEFFKDLQSILEPIQVRNPYALQLKIPESVFKPLRTNAHYLHFIESITFYHQYQRERKRDDKTGKHYIETTLSDIAEANKLLKDVLLAKSDELTKSCRDFFERLKQWVTAQKTSSFYSKEVRIAFKISPTSLNRHLKDLTRYGYINIVGGSKARGYEYEIPDEKEYDTLKDHIDNALDHALAQLRKTLEKK